MNIELDAPIAIGTTVFNVSKVIRYKIAYKKFSKYETLYDYKVDIVGGDTDSFFIEVTSANLLRILYPKLLQDGLLDTSNYSKSHPLFSEKYKALLGCTKY